MLLGMLCVPSMFAEAWPIILLLSVPPILGPCHFHMHHFHSFQLVFILSALNHEQNVSTPKDT